MESPKEVAPQRLLLRISEVAEALGIGRTKIYEMIQLENCQRSVLVEQYAFLSPHYRNG